MMTENQIKNAREIVERIDKALENDENYEGCWYTWYGGNTVEFAASIKQVPRYKYITCEIKLNSLTDPAKTQKMIKQLVDDWEKHVTPESVKSFVDFVTFGEKYGWD